MKKDVRYEPHSRVIAHSIAEFVLRCAETMEGSFNHDYEMTLLFLAISTRNEHNVMNDPELRARYASFDEVIPPSLYTPISRLALARSTGLPRETVRRKVAKMIELGVVVEDKRGGLCIRPGIIEEFEPEEVLKPQLRNLRRLFSVLSETGALEKAD